jgi:NADH-quinone oxidoreductase subunit E/NADP-reducing hydrogenase subunit HndA
MSCCSKSKDEKLVELQNFINHIKSSKKNINSYLITILHKTQSLYGYLEKDILKEISQETKIPLPHIWGVATFYENFNLTPIGKNVVSVCMGTACYVKGAADILDALEDELGIKYGETTKDGQFSIHETRCIGTCALAPVMTIGDKLYGQIKASDIPDIIKKYKK